MANNLQDLADIAAIAKANHVPVGVLYGVYGVESDFGRNVTTSSKGAKGAFQFMPQTAAHYHYPYTNNQDHGTFLAQANSAGRYLHDLYAQYGSWDKAIHAYSSGTPTGGYGIAEVQNELKKAPQGGIGAEDIPGVKQVTDAANTVANAAKDTGTAVANFFGLITSLEFWLRIGEGIAGLILIAMGLKTLTGATIPTPIGRV